MCNHKLESVIYGQHDLIAFFILDLEIDNPDVAAIFIKQKLQQVFGVPANILIVCYPDKLQIGNKYITYPFFIEGLENMVDEVLANLKNHRNASTQQTQNSIFDN
tara:strand:- start:226 stop:540 length:315 start_codon:yes stop_codon:yes gene_type:complete